MINFATKFSTLKKELLNEFEIPYALLDYDGRFLWVNEKFTEISGKDKGYHKSVTTVLPALTKQLLQRSELTASIQVALNDRDYRICMKRIYFQTLAKESAAVSMEQSEEYMTALYLFDETELNL